MIDILFSHWSLVNKFQVMAWSVRQQAITRANVDSDLCHHMTSLGHNELTQKSGICISYSSSSRLLYLINAQRCPNYEYPKREVPFRDDKMPGYMCIWSRWSRQSMIRVLTIEINIEDCALEIVWIHNSDIIVEIVVIKYIHVDICYPHKSEM